MYAKSLCVIIKTFTSNVFEPEFVLTPHLFISANLLILKQLNVSKILMDYKFFCNFLFTGDSAKNKYLTNFSLYEFVGKAYNQMSSTQRKMVMSKKMPMCLTAWLGGLRLLTIPWRLLWRMLDTPLQKNRLWTNSVYVSHSHAVHVSQSQVQFFLPSCSI